LVRPSAPPHETCSVFNDIDLEPDRAIHRFVVGQDAEPRVFTPEEAAEELGDPFATLLLLQGRFPRTAGEALGELRAAAGAGDALAEPEFFLLGEGSQIPFTTKGPPVRRGLRFVVACGVGSRGADVILSAFRPDEGDVELMAWDGKAGGFNFYRTTGESRSWIFAGNSRHALNDATEGKGPFESHTSGAPLMKELRPPWSNWDSPDAPVEPTVFAEDGSLREHPWFLEKSQLGAFTCETKVIRPAIERWVTARFDALAAGGRIEDPRRIMRQVLDTPTVNLVSSKTKSADAASKERLDLPPTFFVDAEALTSLGLPEPPELRVLSAVYLQSLETFEVTLTDGERFSRRGDTHFAFVVPERAFEDQRALAEAIRIGLLTERLAAALLMTDFPNPIFSQRRTALLRHMPDSATVENGESDFSARVADAILAAAHGTSKGSPEREFARLWEAEDWLPTFGHLLTDYYGALASRLASQSGFDDCVRLAESRRERVRQMPIFENELLFSRIKPGQPALAMQADGSVIEI
jgi:hypothetical protein